MKISGNLEDCDYFFDQLVDNKQNFTLKIGNFSSEIEFDKQKLFFTDKKRNPLIFSVVKKIKKDVLPHLNDKIFNDFNYKDLNYFFLNSKMTNDVDFFLNIDIKSCYPSILKNTGFLSPDTISSLENLEKKDKLSILGMLAYSPDLFTFESGILQSQVSLKSKFSNVFFYCVKETEYIMRQIISEIDGKYFFTWVDGIFFPNDFDLSEKIANILSSKNLEFKQSICNNLKTELTTSVLSLSYLKEGELKSLNFPSYSFSNHKKFKKINDLVKNDKKNIYQVLDSDFFIDSFGTVRHNSQKEIN